MKEIPFKWKGAQMKCLIDGCDTTAKSRGLCTTCYNAAANSIKKRRTTWEQLEEAGLTNKPQHKGSGHGAFTQAFRNKLGPLSGDIFDRDKDIKELHNDMLD